MAVRSFFFLDQSLKKICDKFKKLNVSQLPVTIGSAAELLLFCFVPHLVIIHPATWTELK